MISLVLLKIVKVRSLYDEKIIICKSNNILKQQVIFLITVQLPNSNYLNEKIWGVKSFN